MISGLLKGFVTEFLNNKIFLPGPPSSENAFLYRHPEERGIQYENIFLDSTDKARINMWYMGHAESKADRPTILYLHGQKGNMGGSLDRLENFYKAGSNVAAVDYRGYGESVGYPNEAGVLNDVKAVLKHLQARGDLDPTKIFLYGHSLGGAIAIGTASENSDKLAGCMLENTFHDFLKLALEMFPAYGFLEGLMGSPFDSAKKIKNFTVPTLFIVGLKDNLINPGHMARLFKDCTSMMKWSLVVENGDHGDAPLLNPTAFQECVKKFMSAAVAPAGSQEMERTFTITDSQRLEFLIPDPKLGYGQQNTADSPISESLQFLIPPLAESRKDTTVTPNLESLQFLIPPLIEGVLAA